MDRHIVFHLYKYGESKAANKIFFFAGINSILSHGAPNFDDTLLLTALLTLLHIREMAKLFYTLPVLFQ